MVAVPLHQRFFLGFLVFGLLVVAFFVVKPFIIALLSAGILAFIFHPVFSWLSAKTSSPNVSAGLVTLIAVLLISIPILLVLNAAGREAHDVYVRAREFLHGDQVQCTTEITSNMNSGLCTMLVWLAEVTSKPDAQSVVKSLGTKALEFAGQQGSTVVASLPRTALNLFVMVFTLFFLLRDGQKFVKKIYGILPLSSSHEKHVKRQVSDVLFATVYGSLIVAVIQGILGAIGFWFAGFPHYFIWGLVMAVLALIPFVGPWIVWFPAAAQLFLDAYLGSGSLVTAIIFLLYGVFIVSGVDNVLKPFLIGDRARVHPVLIMIGALGGILVFGPIGFILGPLTLALVKVTFEVYEQEVSGV